MSNNKLKIKELKALIQEEQDKMVDFIKQVTVDLTDEQKKVRQEEFAKMRSTLAAYQEELKIVKMNKNMSSAFEWIPNKGLNRKQRKEYAKMKHI